MCLTCQVRAGDDVFLVGVANERFLVSLHPPNVAIDMMLLFLYFDLSQCIRLSFIHTVLKVMTQHLRYVINAFLTLTFNYTITSHGRSYS